MRIVCLSDTHTMGPQIRVPDGDVLVHAGDHSFRGTEKEVREAFEWLASLPHRHKVAVAGNHDFYFDEGSPTFFRSWPLVRKTPIADLLAEFPGITYLQDSGAELEGVKFYGSPWQPWYYDWAFNFPHHDFEGVAAATWAKIPADTNILVTHTPPRGILDATYPNDERQGCLALRLRLHELRSLRLHVFGHLHESAGKVALKQGEAGIDCTFVNASINTREYEPTNEPIVVDLDFKGGKPT